MTSQYRQTLLLAVVVAGSSTNTQCPKIIHGQMPCKKSEQSLFVKAGDILTLNCTCFNKTNGQWTGPNRQQGINSTDGQTIPYTQGTDLNKKLNKSKYQVSGGYDVKTCHLKINNFLSDDDGEYMCQYFDSSTIYILVYNIIATNISTENQNGMSTHTEIYTFETKHMTQPNKTFWSIEWVLALVAFIITSIAVIAFLLWLRKDKGERKSSRIEEIEEVSQDDSVENRLYQSSDVFERYNVRGHHRVFRNEALSSSMIHADERYRATANETGHSRGGCKVSQNTRPQINEISMNYSEVMFDVQPSAHHFIIHGNDEKTMYSEIDHAIRAEPLPSSSSESEED